MRCSRCGYGNKEGAKFYVESEGPHARGQRGREERLEQLAAAVIAERLGLSASLQAGEPPSLFPPLPDVIEARRPLQHGQAPRIPSSSPGDPRGGVRREDAIEERSPLPFASQAENQGQMRPRCNRTNRDMHDILPWC